MTVILNCPSVPVPHQFRVGQEVFPCLCSFDRRLYTRLSVFKMVLLYTTHLQTTPSEGSARSYANKDALATTTMTPPITGDHVHLD